ncbi:chromate transporter [Labrys okinawensis]|uniref:Chromate transporter n=1 Tax=Labrys okinawensis TaxID=346911 RepID=A0A2S9QCZ8_9HYPH|nr:chromate transporter [Labrys okinawensis]PRH87217.1 chromate transporter [Labrys okinawensis]
MDAASSSLSVERKSPDIADLFCGFLTLGLIGFGGVLPLARRMVVEERGWLNGQEFADLLGLCQFLPGGNIINMSVAIGLRFRGVAGACAALLGLIAAPTAIVIGLGMLYDRFQADPHIHHLFGGLAAAAAGLLISMAIKVARPLRRDPAGILIACACFLAIAVLRLPLPATMLVLAPLGILLAWRKA